MVYYIVLSIIDVICLNFVRLQIGAGPVICIIPLVSACYETP